MLTIKKIIKKICYFLTNVYQKLFHNVQILDSLETVKKIKQEKLCVARYGDGEFALIRGRDVSFQESSRSISEKLSAVLQSDMPNLLICVPLTMSTLDGMTPYAATFWKENLAHTKFRFLRCLDKNKQYGNSLFTRPYMDYLDVGFNATVFDEIMSLFVGKDILMVEGEYTRAGVGNSLFSQAKSIQRIICPSKNAYDRYDEILTAIKKHGKDKLILLALGPTATALAYDLACDKENRYWALDIGHLDVEYEWFLSNAKYKQPVKGKYVNEAGGLFSQELEDSHMQQYISEIVLRIV